MRIRNICAYAYTHGSIQAVSNIRIPFRSYKRGALYYRSIFDKSFSNAFPLFRPSKFFQNPNSMFLKSENMFHVIGKNFNSPFGDIHHRSRKI